MANPHDHDLDEDGLAQELRAAFGLGPDASGFEVDLTPPRGSGSSGALSRLGRSQRQERGTLLGDFEIMGELGRGGMGVVYRARQVSLGREVALKVLPDYAHRGPKAIQRFRNEARAAARLQHTNIVPIYAQGEDRETFYYAMELIEGASLDAAIRGRTRLLSPSNPALSAGLTDAGSADASVETRVLAQSPSLRSASPAETVGNVRQLFRHRQDYAHLARLLADVADGLDHAHQAGVIHRDIKPQNLLVGRDGRLHITDFGLARLMDAPTLTMSGEVMGTPAYLSPEQARADIAAIDGRTDIYSLGVTLYELLTLHRPFEGETREQVLTGIKEREPRAPRTFDEHIPRDLQTVCLKAMEKDPARRYTSAGAMAEDLRRFADGRPILSRPAGPVTKAIKWARRHKAASTAIVAIFFVLLLSGGLAASVITARHREGRALIAGVYDRLVYYDYHVTPGQLTDLDEAADLGGDPDDIDLLRALAQLFDRDDRTQRTSARSALADIVADRPDDADAKYLYAIALDRTGRFNEATGVVAEADMLGTATAAGWFFRGLVWQFHDADEAIRSYDMAGALRAADGDVFLQAMLNEARARNQRMYATRTVDDLGAILRPLEQIVEFDLYKAYPHYLLSTAHRLAAEVYTGSAGARDASQLAADHYAEALRWARLGEEKNPDDAVCFTAEAMAHQSMGALADAVAALDAAQVAAANQRVRECEVLHYRWRLHYWLGDYPAATADLAAYPDCAGRDARLYAHFYPMLILAGQGRFAEARAEAFALSGDATTNALAVVWTASALRLLGDEDAAQDWLRAHTDTLASPVGDIPQQTPEWIRGVYRLAEGELPLGELLSVAQECPQPWRLTGEAEFHAAAMALAADNREAALAGFERAWRAYDSATRYTYQGELISRKMRLDPDWPRWISPGGT